MWLPRHLRLADSGFHRTHREIGQCHGNASQLLGSREANDGFATDRRRHHDKVSRKWVLANIFADILRNAILFIPNDFAVVGVQSDVQAGQFCQTHVRLNQSA